MGTARTFVVTGGGGFVGLALCRALRARGDSVVSIARGQYAALDEIGVRQVQADISTATDLSSIIEGAEAVFHTAAKVEMWGRFWDFFAVNVQGTRVLLDSCRRAGIRKFIFTSSPSVVAGSGDLRGVDERQPYPAYHEAFYPHTKALAEREVLAASGPELHTISLRPHLIFGPGDRNFVPTILSRARAGRLLRVGNGKNLTDLCYIDDCVAAHLQAEAALDANPSCRGKAYFITQGEPVLMWEWIDTVLELHGLPRVRRALPASVARFLASLLESYARFRGGSEVPLLTTFLVHEMCSNHYFDISAAGRDLGFAPSLSVAEATKRIVEGAAQAAFQPAACA